MYLPNLEPGSPVAFFQHGLFSSADTWVMHQTLSPAFRAAKAGYDVWLGNNRGTKYSRNHNTLNALVNFKEYSDYSFIELAKYDAPAQIDFVRHMTGKDKITYIGHSQGTTQMFAALAEGYGDL
jgi:pimeloyl-ACP methyl ester carboxylesterase